jgi:CII-binding regulator of phage lambda lysogenization HflD
MKLQEEWHKQETQELNKNLICVRKENEQLILEILLMDEKLRQSTKEAKKLREEISFLQQKMQPCDNPAQINHDTAVGEIIESWYVWPKSNLQSGFSKS